MTINFVLCITVFYTIDTTLRSYINVGKMHIKSVMSYTM